MNKYKTKENQTENNKRKIGDKSARFSSVAEREELYYEVMDETRELFHWGFNGKNFISGYLDD